LGGPLALREWGRLSFAERQVGGLGGDGVHLSKYSLKVLAVGYPFLVEAGLLLGKAASDGLALDCRKGASLFGKSARVARCRGSVDRSGGKAAGPLVEIAKLAVLSRPRIGLIPLQVGREWPLLAGLCVYRVCGIKPTGNRTRRDYQ